MCRLLLSDLLLECHTRMDQAVPIKTFGALTRNSYFPVRRSLPRFYPQIPISVALSYCVLGKGVMGNYDWASQLFPRWIAPSAPFLATSKLTRLPHTKQASFYLHLAVRRPHAQLLSFRTCLIFFFCPLFLQLLIRSRICTSESFLVKNSLSAAQSDKSATVLHCRIAPSQLDHYLGT